VNQSLRKAKSCPCCNLSAVLTQMDIFEGTTQGKESKSKTENRVKEETQTRSKKAKNIKIILPEDDTECKNMTPNKQ